MHGTDISWVQTNVDIKYRICKYLFIKVAVDFLFSMVVTIVGDRDNKHKWQKKILQNTIIRSISITQK